MQTVKFTPFCSRFKPHTEMYNRLHLKDENLWKTRFENLTHFYLLAFFIWSERVLLERNEEH